ncbi:MAG: NAD-dependent epimerase/dehydratase family protein, partial [Planctomycetes bacterium]|nr:NAD-dependent epimerase/dehydratase family protein [Planctomycetota bacterium]
MRNALFIGGTGTISMSITKLLAEQGGWKLYVLNRGKRNANLPEGVESLVADINDVAEVKKAVGPLTFDVVADFIAFTPDQVKRDIDLFAGRTGQYIFISSASAYHKPVADLPITESTPLKNPFWQYSRDKIACEDLLVREFRDNDFPITIV